MSEYQRYAAIAIGTMWGIAGVPAAIVAFASGSAFAAIAAMTAGVLMAAFFALSSIDC